MEYYHVKLCFDMQTMLWINTLISQHLDHCFYYVHSMYMMMHLLSLTFHSRKENKGPEFILMIDSFFF